jgi:hypothetical protein
MVCGIVHCSRPLRNPFRMHAIMRHAISTHFAPGPAPWMSSSTCQVACAWTLPTNSAKGFRNSSALLPYMNLCHLICLLPVQHTGQRSGHTSVAISQIAVQDRPKQLCVVGVSFSVHQSTGGTSGCKRCFEAVQAAHTACAGPGAVEPHASTCPRLQQSVLCSMMFCGLPKGLTHTNRADN